MPDIGLVNRLESHDTKL